MNERDVAKLLAKALDRGLIQGFTRQRRGWQIRERGNGTRMLSRSEVVRYARRLSGRL